MRRKRIHGLWTRFSSSVNLTESEKRPPPSSTPPQISSEGSSHVSSKSTSDQKLPHFPGSRNSENVNSVVSGDTNTNFNYITVNNVVLGEPHTSNGGTRTGTTPSEHEDVLTESKETSVAGPSIPFSSGNLPPGRTLINSHSSKPVSPIGLEVLNSMLNDIPAEPIPHSHLRAASEVYRSRSEVSMLSSTNNTIISGRKSEALVDITFNNLKDYVPKTMDPDALGYMSTNLFLKRNIIPLWDPSPSVSTGPHAWRRYNGIGDVGYFNERGGISTLFNVFQTVEQNVAMWEYSPPKGFTPCLVPITEITGDPKGDRQDSHFDHDMMYTSGFTTQIGESGSTCLYTIRLPKMQAKRKECYALHMMHGYLERHVNSRGGHLLETYLLQYLDSWRRHGEAEGTWPWVLVAGTYKTKSWSMAVGTKPGLSAKHSMAELKKSNRFVNMQHWSTSDRSAIQTRYGPDSDSLKMLESYMMSPGAPKPGTREYQDTEECHCVALRAISLNPPEKGLFATRTRGSYVGSNSSFRSILSWRTTPVNYRPMNLEEITEST